MLSFFDVVAVTVLAVDQCWQVCGAGIVHFDNEHVGIEYIQEEVGAVVVVAEVNVVVVVAVVVEVSCSCGGIMIP